MMKFIHTTLVHHCKSFCATRKNERKPRASMKPTSLTASLSFSSGGRLLIRRYSAAASHFIQKSAATNSQQQSSVFHSVQCLCELRLVRFERCLLGWLIRVRRGSFVPSWFECGITTLMQNKSPKNLGKNLE